eukprot:52684-Prorocentrum_minimum.AAC.1
MVTWPGAHKVSGHMRRAHLNVVSNELFQEVGRLQLPIVRPNVDGDKVDSPLRHQRNHAPSSHRHNHHVKILSATVP